MHIDRNYDARVSKARRRAGKMGLRLSKSRKPDIVEYHGGFQLTDERNSVVCGYDTPFRAHGAWLEEIEDYLGVSR